MNLRAADLNLFVVLDALLEEGSVSRAARKLGLSQPATSNALARLRDTLDDPLFVRRGSQMLPTPRALEIAAHVRAGLGHLDAALAPPAQFDPGVAERTFVVAANDLGSFLLLPWLMPLLAREAPRVTVRVAPYAPQRPFDAMQAGTIDLILGSPNRRPPGVESETVLEERFAVAVRDGHPRVRKRLTLKQYVELEHLLVAPLGGSRGYVDTALDALGLQRKIAVFIPDFLLAPHIVARTDLVVTQARRVLEDLGAVLNLRVFDPPVPLSPFPVAIMWDERRTSEPAHRWLRSAVDRALREGALTGSGSGREAR